MAEPSDLEEQLAEEQQRQEELERLQQQERQRAQSGVGGQAKEFLKQQAKQAVKKVAIRAGKKLAARGAASILAATAPWWGTALLVIAGIGLILFVVIMIPVVACNASVTDGLGVAAMKVIVAAIPGDVCAAFKINSVSPLVRPQLTTPDDPQDLVSLAGLGIPVKPGIGDDRARQCMGAKVLRLRDLSRAEGIEWEITSAYRPGDQPSRHAFGEGVDIALRNPTAGLGSSDPRIDRLVALARQVGFAPPPGDTVDEYRNRTERTTGGHIHIEFNASSTSRTGSYCDLS